MHAELMLWKNPIKFHFLVFYYEILKIQLFFKWESQILTLCYLTFHNITGMLMEDSLQKVN